MVAENLIVIEAADDKLLQQVAEQVHAAVKLALLASAHVGGSPNEITQKVIDVLSLHHYLRSAAEYNTAVARAMPTTTGFSRPTR
jgi:hypothetical protein